MAVKTRDEIMEAIKARLGDDTSDEALAIIEDVNDTFSDYETRATDDWKTKYYELDSNWRKRYRDRFFQSPGNKETDKEEVVNDNEEDLKDEDEEKTFESLFEEKEDNSGY